MGRVDIDVVYMCKIGSELDYHPSVSYSLIKTYQSKEGLCRLDSHASYRAPVGPNCPFIDTLGLSISQASRHQGSLRLTYGLIRLSLEAKKSSDTDRTLPPRVSTVTSEDLARDG
jgi:hypothetical protein